MLCNKCQKNEATCFMEKNINGKVTKLALCTECAKKTDEFNFDPFADLNLFGNFFGLPSTKRSVVGERKRCTLCASTFDDIINNGKVGCAECYRVFADELAPTIRRIHGQRNHVGRSPRKLDGTVSDKQEELVPDEKNDAKKQIKLLKRELSEAVKAEEYEKAAQLRDKIRECENTSN